MNPTENISRSFTRSPFGSLVCWAVVILVFWIAPQANSERANLSHINVAVDSSGDLVLSFEPIAQNGQKLEIHTSTDLETWTLVATRPSGNIAWDSSSAVVNVDPENGAVTATIPAQGVDKLYARVNVSSDPIPSDDADGDGILDWLESHVENNIPEGQDTDGDGISDQIELLLGSDIEVDEFAAEEARVASFPTALKVFTPITE